MPKKIKTAVITGGHSYDVPGFHRLFCSLQGMDVYIQHMDDFTSSSQEVRDGYDVLVFYTMFSDEPVNDGAWYQGAAYSVLDDLGSSPQGIVLLHHSLVAYPKWPRWSELVGIENRVNRKFLFDQFIHVKVTQRNHPITRGLIDWEMVDETYLVDDAGEGNDILLTIDHPESMHTIAWTRQYRQSRVFCCQLGHDDQAWNHPNFRRILRRGLQWTAGQI
jgi:hypothetical protein